ncbi:MAG TPA: 4Fe-4S binding protein [Dehalococcoidales bacterium]|nr:4Fe-4S binding protein [Dehalococcoidales bacterium]
MSSSKTETSQHEVYVMKEWCKGCRFCVEFCPQHILYETDETNSRGYHVVAMTDSSKCIGCEMCTMVCPEFAIHVFATGEEAGQEAK